MASSQPQNVAERRLGRSSSVGTGNRSWLATSSLWKFGQRKDCNALSCFSSWNYRRDEYNSVVLPGSQMDYGWHRLPGTSPMVWTDSSKESAISFMIAIHCTREIF